MYLILSIPIFAIVTKGCGRLNQILVLVYTLICANVCFCAINKGVISELLSSAIESFPKQFDKNTSGLVQLVQNIDLVQNTTTYCFEDEGLSSFYRDNIYVLYKEDIIDQNKSWVRISNQSHHSFFVYEEWENQTLIILKQNSEKRMGYYALKLYIREIFGRAVYEWDLWKPKDFESNNCQKSLVAKFFHPCSNWEYCELSNSLKDKPKITRSEIINRDESVCQVRTNFDTPVDNYDDSKETDQESLPPMTPYQSSGFVNEYYEERTLRTTDEQRNETYGSEMQFEPLRPDFMEEMNKEIGNIPVNIMKNLERSEILSFKKKKRELPRKQYSEIPKGCMYSFGPFFGDILDDKNSAEFVSKTIARKRFHLPIFDSFKPRFPPFLPFVGFTDCRFKSLSHGKVKNSSNLEEIVSFFTSTMRAQCLKDSLKGDLMKIFQNGLVILKPGLIIQLNLNQHLLFKERVIKPQEENFLETAIYFSAYSQIYPRLLSEMKSNTNTTFIATTGLRISRNTRTITYLVLSVYDIVQKSLPFHTIKFFRNMVSFLRNNILLRLQEKADLIFRCPNSLSNECNEQLTRNLDNRIQIMALIQFIVFGTNPLKAPNEDTITRFTKFYSVHKDFVVKQVKKYDVSLMSKILP